MKRSAILGIDLMRFVAATAVICWHFAGKPFLSPAGSTLTPLMPQGLMPQGVAPPGAAFSWFGWIGVEIFFVISGVVIAYSAELATARTFFVGRIARLWPAMFVSATLCSVLSLLIWHTPVRSQIFKYLGSLIFAPVGPWYSGQVWTLPVEIVFYAVVWGLVATRRMRWIEPLAWGLATASLCYWIVVAATGLPMPDKYVTLLLVPHGCYFATGILLTRLTASGVTRAHRGLLALAIVTAVAAAMIEIVLRSASEMRGSTYGYAAVVPCLIWIGSVAVIAGAMAWRDAIALWLTGYHGVFKLMGALTYPLYLVHYQTGGPVFAALYGRGVPVWLALVPAYLVALACAYLIARFAEPPLSSGIKTRLPILLDGIARWRRPIPAPAI